MPTNTHENGLETLIVDYPINKEQKDLARLLVKGESEISKCMTGTHNFTIKTLSKIEAILGERLF